MACVCCGPCEMFLAARPLELPVSRGKGNYSNPPGYLELPSVEGCGCGCGCVIVCVSGCVYSVPRHPTLNSHHTKHLSHSDLSSPCCDGVLFPRALILASLCRPVIIVSPHFSRLNAECIPQLTKSRNAAPPFSPTACLSDVRRVSSPTPPTQTLRLLHSIVQFSFFSLSHVP